MIGIQYCLQTCIFLCITSILGCKVKKEENIYVSHWYEKGIEGRIFHGKADILSIDGNCEPKFNYSGVIRDFFTGTEVNIYSRTSVKIDRENNSLILDQISSTQALSSIAQPFTPCDTNNPNDLDTAAVAIASDIDQAKIWYDTVVNDKKAIEDLSIEVQPLIRTTKSIVFKGTEGLINPPEDQLIAYDIIDNAFWSPPIADDPSTIGFFPHGVQLDNQTSLVLEPFWKLPFVARHEYGHHLFYAHMTRIFNNESFNYRNYLMENPYTHTTTQLPSVSKMILSKFNPNFLSSPALPRVDNNFMISALNEGFADLYSSYSLQGTIPNIQNYPCFIDARDPMKEKLKGNFGERKQWSLAILNALFDNSIQLPEENDEGTKTCPNFSPLRHHHVGSIIAFTVNQLLDESHSVTEDPINSWEIKTNLLLKWLDNLNKNLDPSDKGPKALLSQILEIAFDVATEDNANLQPESQICNTVRQYFSGWTDYWSPLGLNISTCINN